MFIAKNQDGTFSVSQSRMINDGSKWIHDDPDGTTKISTLFGNSTKDAENFENALNLDDPLSSDDYDSLEIVSKSELTNKIFDYLSDSLTHILDSNDDTFWKKQRILQGLEDFLDGC